MSKTTSDPLSQRRPATQQRAEVLLAAVREAARLILEEDGPKGLTTNRIAERAGVSIGSVYHYYPNKDAIIADLFDALVEDVIREIAEKQKLKPFSQMPLPEAFLWFASTVLEDRSRIAGLHRDFLEKWGYRFDYMTRETPEGRSIASITHDSLVALLESHRDEISVEDVDAAAYGVFLVVEGFSRACWQERLPEPSIDRISPRIASAMLAYVGYDADGVSAGV